MISSFSQVHILPSQGVGGLALWLDAGLGPEAGA